MLDINTTVPSMVKRNFTACSFNASHKMIQSIKVAYVTFRDNVELKNGSRVIVTGKYALSITSQNGNIIIQTDINMTCNRVVFDTTCLGGFTQSSQPTQIGKDQTIYKGEVITFNFFLFFFFYNFLCFYSISGETHFMPLFSHSLNFQYFNIHPCDLVITNYH